MASKTMTETEIRQSLQDFADNEVKREAKAAIGEFKEEKDSPWGGVEQFIVWMRTKVGKLGMYPM